MFTRGRILGLAFGCLMRDIQSPLQGVRSPFGGRRTDLASLFLPGNVGILFEPQRRDTLWQDAAGATPVTTYGQGIQLLGDRSQGMALGPELWADQTPTITEVGSTSTWTAGTKTMATTGGTSGQYPWFSFALGLVTGQTYDVAIALSGDIAKLQSIMVGGVTLAASAMVRAKVSATAAVMVFKFIGTAGAATVAINSITVRELKGRHATQANAASALIYGRHPAGGVRNLLLATDVLATQSKTTTAVAHTLAFTGTGTVTLSGASTAGPLVGTGAGNRVSLTFTPSAGSLTLTVSGSVTLGQLEIGSSATAYQRVGNAYDVTEAGKADCCYGLFDGADNSLATAAFAWGSDKATIIAAVRKNVDSPAGIVAEYSANSASNAGTFYLSAGNDAGAIGTSVNGYSSLSRGSAAAFREQSGQVAVAAPDTAVISVTHDIAGDLSAMRRNGVNGTNGAADKGTGNFGSYPLYIGRRGGTTLPFNGLLYGLLIINRILSAEELALAERLMAAKCGVTL